MTPFEVFLGKKYNFFTAQKLNSAELRSHFHLTMMNNLLPYENITLENLFFVPMGHYPELIEHGIQSIQFPYCFESTGFPVSDTIWGSFKKYLSETCEPLPLKKARKCHRVKNARIVFRLNELNGKHPFTKLSELIMERILYEYTLLYYRTGGYRWDVFKTLLAAKGDKHCLGIFGELPVELIVMISKMASTFPGGEEIQSSRTTFRGLYLCEDYMVRGEYALTKAFNHRCYRRNFHDIMFGTEPRGIRIFYHVSGFSVAHSIYATTPENIFDVNFQLNLPICWEEYLEMYKRCKVK